MRICRPDTVLKCAGNSVGRARELSTVQQPAEPRVFFMKVVDGRLFASSRPSAEANLEVEVNVDWRDTLKKTVSWRRIALVVQVLTLSSPSVKVLKDFVRFPRVRNERDHFVLLSLILSS